MVERINSPETDTWVAWYQGYDQMVVRWILDNIKRSNKSVPAVFATPERAFGQMSKFLSKRYNRAVTIKNLPLPFMSIQRLDATLDGARWRPARVRKARAMGKNSNPVIGPFIHPDDTEKAAMDTYQGYDWPQPTNIRYQLEAWSRTLFDLDLISNQLLLSFKMGDAVWLPVQHPFPFAWRKVPVIFTREANASQLEATEGQERTLRRTYEFIVGGWIPKPATEVKIVKRVDLDIHEQSSGDLMEAHTLWDEDA